MQSMSAFVAQNMGAKQEKRAKNAMLTGMAVGAGIGVLFFALSFFAGEALSSLFSPNPAYIARSAEYLRGFSPECILTCILFSYIGYFSGCKRTVPVMIQGITSSFLIRVPLSWLFCVLSGSSLSAIGLAAPLSSLYGIIFFTISYEVMQKKTAKGAGS